ncbi:tricarboxylate transport protein, mitochondrial precursor [Acephala macrosclerotiorum]|nr:tricarboxylate transport protein, mitochondrial precursor [Acephala macrosclerotiorum]
MSSSKHADILRIVSLISGGVAGGAEGFLTYPFEFAKTRIQLRSKTGKLAKLPRNPYSVVTSIYRMEGLGALYKGCGALVSAPDKETGTLTPARNMLAGMTVGVVPSVTAVTPTERIKTALIDDARSSHRYKSTTHCIRLTIHEDGLKGLYRSLAGTTLKQASATSFRMGSYNIIKISNPNEGLTKLRFQPFDMVKTRSQVAEVTTTMMAVKSVLREDGIRGFWRGTVMRLSRTVFSGGILFTTAEAVAKIINPLIGR